LCRLYTPIEIFFATAIVNFEVSKSPTVVIENTFGWPKKIIRCFMTVVGWLDYFFMLPSLDVAGRPILTTGSAAKCEKLGHKKGR